MSIMIDRSKCVGCGRCTEVCPGNLIKTEERKAYIIRPEDCWGCTSCLKECRSGAILFFLGADIGGKGAVLSVTEKGDVREWVITAPDGKTRRIETNTKESNKY